MWDVACQMHLWKKRVAETLGGDRKFDYKSNLLLGRVAKIMIFVTQLNRFKIG